MLKKCAIPKQLSSVIFLVSIALFFSPSIGRAQTATDLAPSALIAGGQYAAWLRGFMDIHEVDGKDGPKTRSVLRKMGDKDLNSIENLTLFSRRAQSWHPELIIEITSDLVTKKVEAVVAAHLRDPNSLILRDVHLRGQAICGYFNAKNAFGGYVGFAPFALTARAFWVFQFNISGAYLDREVLLAKGVSETEANSRTLEELEAIMQSMREELLQETSQKLLFLDQENGGPPASTREIGEVVYECYLRGYDGGLPYSVMDLSL